MKIAFIGDSITEGVPGVSYVDKLKALFPSDELVNLGKGGDTVKSIFKRIKSINNLESYDTIVLFVGINDLYSKLTTTYKILKVLTKQTWTKDLDGFMEVYNNIIEYLLTKTSNIIIIPPLLMGENLENKWNQTLNLYVYAIKQIVKDNHSIKYLNVRTQFIDYLQGKNISDYLPYKINRLLKDVKELTKDEDVDLTSLGRGLHLMLDGVHINSKGAEIIVENVQTALLKDK